MQSECFSGYFLGTDEQLVEKLSKKFNKKKKKKPATKAKKKIVVDDNYITK